MMADNALPRLLINPEKRKPRHDGSPILCAVSGCGVKIESKYHRRFRLCKEHLKCPVLLCGTRKLRFCQQCNKLQPTDDFNGIQRNCRWSLQKRVEKGAAKGAKAPEKKGKNRRERCHPRDHDSSTMGSDGDVPVYSNRKAPSVTGSVLGPLVTEVNTEDAGQCLSSNVPQRSREGKDKDIDSAKMDTGEGDKGRNIDMAMNAKLVRKDPHPVFIRCDSNSSRNGSPEIDMSNLISDAPESGADPIFGAQPPSMAPSKGWSISDDDLPYHLNAPCNCGKCDVCLSAQEATSSTDNCWPFEPIGQAPVDEQKFPCGGQNHLDPKGWGVGAAYDSTDPMLEYFTAQKVAYPEAEGHSVCAAPLQQEAIYPISLNTTMQRPGHREWHDPVPSPLSRNGLGQHQEQQCSDISHPHLAAEASLLHSIHGAVATAGTDLHLVASPRARAAQFGHLSSNLAPQVARPCLKYVQGPADVAPDFSHTQGPLYSLPLAMEEPGMLPVSATSRIQQCSERPMPMLSRSHSQTLQQSSPPHFSSDPFAFAQAASRQAPMQRPGDLVHFYRRSVKMPEAGHSPQMDLLERFVPIVANGNLVAESRAMLGCVRVVVTVATTQAGVDRNAAIVDSPIERDEGNSGFVDCGASPSDEEFGAMSDETTMLQEMASQLPNPASPSARSLATASCWIQTEQHLGRVVDGYCQYQWDLDETRKKFNILAIQPACFLASGGNDVRILGRGLGSPGRVLCSFNAETRVLDLSLTRISVGSDGKVEIIKHQNNNRAVEHTAVVGTSEASALVKMACGEVKVGDTLEIWSGRVKPFHGVGVAYVEAERNHLLTDPVPVLVVRDEGIAEDIRKLEHRLPAPELRQTIEDVGQVLSFLANGEVMAETERGDDRIDFAMWPCNDQANPEYRAMMVSLANWHVGNSCRQGFPGLMKAMLPASLLSGGDFSAIAESQFNDGFTLLHYAVMSGVLEVIQALMDLGTHYGHKWRWDIAGPLGVTPLHMLAVNDHAPSLLQLATSVHPDVATLWFESAASNGETPEQFAVRAGHSDLNILARNHRAPCLDSERCDCKEGKESSTNSDNAGMTYVRSLPVGNCTTRKEDDITEECISLVSQDWFPKWTGALMFSDPKLECRFKDYRGQRLNGSDGLCVLLYLLCCLYVLLMMAVGNCKQPAKVLWREENVLPYVHALLPLGLPLAANWALQSLSWYYKWRESIVVGGCLWSLLTSLYFGLGPMQWFLSRWSSNLFVVGFLACRMSFAPQVRLCYQLGLHAAEICIALFAAFRHGMVLAVFTECFCMIMAMAADMAWTYCEEKQSRVHFMSDNKLQCIPLGKSGRKVD